MWYLDLGCLLNLWFRCEVWVMLVIDSLLSSNFRLRFDFSALETFSV